MLDSSTAELLVRFKVCKTFPVRLAKVPSPIRKLTTLWPSAAFARNFSLRVYVSQRDFMWRLARFLLSASLSLLSVSFACAQDASKIIDQYIKAAGGAKALSHLQTFAVDGNVANTGDSQPGTFTFMVKQPNR